MEDLYSRSGQSLTVLVNLEEEDRWMEIMEDEEAADDGFVVGEPEDLTVPVLYETLNTSPEDSGVSLASPSSSSGPSTSSSQDSRSCSSRGQR